MKIISGKRILCCVILLAFLAMSLAACGSTAATTTVATSTTKAQASSSSASSSSVSTASSSGELTGKPIYIAYVCPMTGNNGQYGQAFKNAAEILIDKVNKSGGINGSKLIVDYYDDKNDQKEAVIVAQKVVSENKYIAVVGSQGSGCSMAMAPIYQKAKIIQFSPVSSHPDFTRLGDYIFRLNYTIEYFGPAHADYAIEHFKTRRPGIIYINNDYATSHYKESQKRYKQYGLDYVAAETYIPETVKDFTPLISKLKAANCDLFVAISSYADVAQMVIQAKKLDFNVPIFCDNMSGTQDFLTLTGKASEGVTFLDSFYQADTREPFASFKKEFEARYNKLVDSYSTQSYDTLWIIVEALKKHGPNVQAVRDEIAKTNGFSGVSGKIILNSERSRMTVFSCIEVKNGKFEYIGDFSRKPDSFVPPILGTQK